MQAKAHPNRMGGVPWTPAASLALDWTRLLDALDGVVYLTDAAGFILTVGAPGWDEFARRNGIGEGGSRAFMARDIFSQITGPAVVATARAVHDAVARGRRPAIQYPYRCDAPDRRRHMRMAISRLESDTGAALVLYQSQLLSETQRPAINLFDPRVNEAHHRPGHGLATVRMCSYCQQVGWPQDASEPAEWIEAETYYARGGSGTVVISHGVCPGCASALLA